jgi:hypothetical protein
MAPPAVERRAGRPSGRSRRIEEVGMKTAFLFAVAGVALCAAPGLAADESYRRVGYEVGGWRWTETADGPVERGDSRAIVLSVGRWQRLTRAVTWMTRLEYGDLPDFRFAGAEIPERHEWTDLGHSVTFETGFALHPPVTVGLAPYVGVNLGLGEAHLGDRHMAYFTGDGWRVANLASRGLVPVVVAGAETGLRVFSKRGWPGLCASLGFRVVAGAHGAGVTAEPVLSLGY